MWLGATPISSDASSPRGTRSPRTRASTFRSIARARRACALARNRNELEQAGAREVVGFRAPIFSLTEQSAWAYAVLAELGFLYSSSVLPYENGLHSWAAFGVEPRLRPEGVRELPTSATRLLGRNLPFAGGVYFRLLPFAISRRLFSRQGASGRSVVGYFHPYDVDTRQERFMHAELGDNPLLNALMYIGRGRVIPRLRSLFASGFTCDSFANHVRGVLAAES